MSGFHHRLIGVQHRPLNFYQTSAVIPSNSVGGLVISSGGTTIIAISSGANAFIRSTDSGVTWSSSADIGTTLNGVSSGNSNLTGSYDAAMLMTGSSSAGGTFNRRSLNAGISWTNVPGLAVNTYENPCCSSDGVIRFLTAGTVIYKSTDSGATWNSFSHSPTVNTKAIAVSGDGNYVVQAPAGTNQLKVSTDGGSTWNSRGPSTNWDSVCVSYDGSIMIASAGVVVYRSTDFGVNWESTSYTLPANMFSLCMSSDGSIVAGITDTGDINEVHLSLDGGITFVSTFFHSNAVGFRILKCDSTGRHFWMSRANTGGYLWKAKLDLA